MFFSASDFNGDLSSWDVSSVNNMKSMFQMASSFNGDLSSWDVSSVGNMHHMFGYAPSFNGDLSSWDVSKVTAMQYMFEGASSFNGDLSSWDISKVTTMHAMFRSASSFNGNLSSWDISKVTDMSNMFYEASSFNGNLSAWNVSSDAFISEESGASGPGETDPWTTCLQNNPEIYPNCPTPGDQPNGTDLGEKFYSDIEYAKSVLRDWPGLSAHIKCLCESKCGQYFKEVWPGNANDRLCNLYLSDGKKCTGDGCCGAGTTYKDGSCVASWGEKDACEDVGHGKHGWKCGSVSDSCEK